MAQRRRAADRLGFALLVAVVATLICGCSGSPEETARNYLDNLKLYNYPACYQALSDQDRMNRTMTQFLAEPPLVPVVSRDWFKAVVRATNYKIVGTRRGNKNEAIVIIKVTRPNLPLWERTIDAAVGSGGSPDQAAQQTLADGAYPKISYDDDIVAVKEKEGWHILVDFPAKDQIENKHRDGIEAYHEHDYQKAIADYQAALASLGDERATGNMGLTFVYQRELAQIQNVKNQIPEAEAYVPKLKLSQTDMKMSASHVPAIFGKITNTGGRAIDEVACTVSYYAGKGRRRKLLYSETHSIIATPLEFINFSRPVLPFVPGETRDFGFRLSAPKKIQQRSAPELAVTAIAFTQSTAPLPKLKPAAAPTAAPEKARPNR